jgi:histidine triad (HIT) family protein
MAQCTFCPIAAGEEDADLVALRTRHAFVVPALRQHPGNHGHALVLPTEHIRNLADAAPEVRNEVFGIAARVTAAILELCNADGSIVFQNNVAPDDPLFHLHVHVVPRFTGDDFVMTRAAVAEVPRRVRLQQSVNLRRALAASV